jgi:hypothetical protein
VAIIAGRREVDEDTVNFPLNVSMGWSEMIEEKLKGPHANPM